MKKTSKPKPTPTEPDDLLPEYDFDYTTAKPNRFATRQQTGAVAVVLDPDVAEVFKDSTSVNAVLRALMQTMPARPRNPQ